MPPSIARHRRVLAAAAAYNVLWGAAVILFPNALFDFAGLPRPNYPQLWQCVGMIVGVYGVGYWVASWDPLRHWPITLVGFLGKVLGPVGFVEAFASGTFNARFGLTILTNDLIWWVPFFVILRDAWRASEARWAALAPAPVESLRLPDGRGLLEASRTGPIMLLFVRHRGCTFCRESLAGLAAALPRLRERGERPVVVHLGSEASGREMQREFGLESVPFVADPDKRFYLAFGRRRGGWRELFGPRVWARGFVAGVLRGHGVGHLEGDGLQLGGVVRVEQGRWRVVHEPRDAADVEDWVAILG